MFFPKDPICNFCVPKSFYTNIGKMCVYVCMSMSEGEPKCDNSPTFLENPTPNKTI